MNCPNLLVRGVSDLNETGGADRFSCECYQAFSSPPFLRRESGTEARFNPRSIVLPVDSSLPNISSFCLLSSVFMFNTFPSV